MDRLGRRAEDAVALVAIAVGAFLRFDGLGTPSYWLDEILHQNIDATPHAWWQWLTPFERENGPFYYVLQLTGSEWKARLLPALFGVAAIALVAYVSRTAALLLAVSPLAVYFSREARPYALLMLLTAVLIVLLMRERTWAACAVIAAILYTGAAGAPIVVGALIVALLLRAWLVAGTAALALVLVPLLYHTNTHVTPNPPFPALDLSFAITLLRDLSVTALSAPVGGRAAVALFALAVWGAVALAKLDRRSALVVNGITLVPLLVTLGALWKFDHWYSPRYIVPCVVGYVALAGYGIDALTRRLLQFIPSRSDGISGGTAVQVGDGSAVTPMIPSLRDGMNSIAAVAIAAVFAWQAWPAVRSDAWQKMDWRAIADKLVQYSRPGDLVIAAEQWSEAGLRYYLRGRLRLEGVPYPLVAEALTYSHPGTWLVTDNHGFEATGGWMCRFPIVLSSAFGGVRVHYAGDFLRERAGPAEWRAIEAATADRFVIDFGAAENRFLDAGWAMPEGFRWAVGARASVTFPRWGARDRTVRMRSMPMEHRTLPPQTVRLSLNGHALGALRLVSGWHDYALRAPAMAWRNGMNTLILDFDHAVAPADLDPKASDHRPLAAAFEWIVIGDGQKSHAYQIRLASAPFIDGQTAWRHTRTRFPPAPPALAGRLGFDPDAASRAHLENLVESVAYGSDCEDDHAFLQRAFAVILDRLPDQHEERALASVLRARVPVRLTKSEEFRREVSAAVPDRP